MAQTLATFKAAATAQGLPWDSSSRFAALYPVVAGRNLPAGMTNASGFATLVEGWLRARGFLYWKTNYGDCPAPSAVPGVNIAGLATNAGVNGGMLAAQVAGVAGAGLAGLTFGVSALASVITSVLQHHQQAVLDEQSTLCAVSTYFNKGINLIDNAVALGQVDAADGVAALKSLVTQTVQGMMGIVKTCNAACIYTGALKAHADFGASFYPAISPLVPSLSPGAPPTAFGSLPGGVPMQANMTPTTPPLRSILPSQMPNTVTIVTGRDVNAGTGVIAQSSGITGKYQSIAPTSGNLGTAQFPPATVFPGTGSGTLLAIAAGILLLFLAFG
jgi:hypothetical protein